MLQIALVNVSNGPQGPELWFFLCLTLIGNCSCCFVFERYELVVVVVGVGCWLLVVVGCCWLLVVGC